MKLRFDYSFPETIVYTVSEIRPESTKLFPWDAVEMSDKEWQDYQICQEAYDKWQSRLAKWMVERVAPTQPEVRPPILGMGRVWDGRSKDEDDGA